MQMRCCVVELIASDVLCYGYYIYVEEYIVLIYRLKDREDYPAMFKVRLKNRNNAMAP